MRSKRSLRLNREYQAPERVINLGPSQYTKSSGAQKQTYQKPEPLPITEQKGFGAKRTEGRLGNWGQKLGRGIGRGFQYAGQGVGHVVKATGRAAEGFYEGFAGEHITEESPREIGRALGKGLQKGLGKTVDFVSRLEVKDPRQRGRSTAFGSSLRGVQRRPYSRLDTNTQLEMTYELDSMYPQIYNKLYYPGITVSELIGSLRDYYPDIYNSLKQMV